MWRKILVLFVLCIVGFGIAFIFLSTRLPEDEGPLVTEEDREDELLASQPVFMHDTFIRGWDKGRLAWTLTAGEMELDREDTTRARGRKGVELLLFSDNGSERAVLRSQEAVIDLDKRDFRFRREVEVVSSSGDRILTEDLFYRDHDQSIESYRDSRVFFGDNYIEAGGLESDVDFENPEFFQVTYGRFLVLPGQ